jgi:hypothetical protein
MSRWGKPRKNKKRIDPRYFLEETTQRDKLDEGWFGFGEKSQAIKDIEARQAQRDTPTPEITELVKVVLMKKFEADQGGSFNPTLHQVIHWPEWMGQYGEKSEDDYRALLGRGWAGGGMITNIFKQLQEEGWMKCDMERRYCNVAGQPGATEIP